MKRQQQKAFSLIELMVVVGIVGILATVSYPAYLNQVRESRRSEVTTTLLSIQANYEEYNTEYNTYPASNTLSSGGAIPNTTNYAYTTVTTPNSYTLTATAMNDQVNDTQNGVSCAVMTLDNTGAKTPTNCWGD
jgi:type IV pilus assembly protein PilE